MCRNVRECQAPERVEKLKNPPINQEITGIYHPLMTHTGIYHPLMTHTGMYPH